MHQKKLQWVTTAPPNENQTKDFNDVKSFNLINKIESADNRSNVALTTTAA
jgi:hypothetical protein